MCEAWHPSYFQNGIGPLHDMGMYSPFLFGDTSKIVQPSFSRFSSEPGPSPSPSRISNFIGGSGFTTPAGSAPENSGGLLMSSSGTPGTFTLEDRMLLRLVYVQQKALQVQMDALLAVLLPCPTFSSTADMRGVAKTEGFSTCHNTLNDERLKKEVATHMDVKENFSTSFQGNQMDKKENVKYKEEEKGSISTPSKGMDDDKQQVLEPATPSPTLMMECRGTPKGVATSAQVIPEQQTGTTPHRKKETGKDSSLTSPSPHKPSDSHRSHQHHSHPHHQPAPPPALKPIPSQPSAPDNPLADVAETLVRGRNTSKMMLGDHAGSPSLPRTPCTSSVSSRDKGGSISPSYPLALNRSPSDRAMQRQTSDEYHDSNSPAASVDKNVWEGSEERGQGTSLGNEGGTSSLCGVNPLLGSSVSRSSSSVSSGRPLKEYPVGSPNFALSFATSVSPIGGPTPLKDRIYSARSITASQRATFPHHPSQMGHNGSEPQDLGGAQDSWVSSSGSCTDGRKGTEVPSFSSMLSQPLYSDRADRVVPQKEQRWRPPQGPLLGKGAPSSASSAIPLPGDMTADEEAYIQNQSHCAGLPPMDASHRRGDNESLIKERQHHKGFALPEDDKWRTQGALDRSLNVSSLHSSDLSFDTQEYLRVYGLFK